VREGKLKPAPVQVFDFKDVGKAHAAIESGTTVRCGAAAWADLALIVAAGMDAWVQVGKLVLDSSKL